jgi:hypothetical protein
LAQATIQQQPGAVGIVKAGCIQARRCQALDLGAIGKGPALDRAAEILAEPRVSLHGYDPAQRIQLRLQCRASLHCDDAVAEAGWNASRDFSRMCYAITPGPGHPAAAPPPAPTDAVSGRENFAVIQLVFNEMEWLWLAADGHRRARFTWGEEPIATWLVP